MSATAFRVPAIDSPNVVYSTAYDAPESGCRVCGGERLTSKTTQVYCSRSHKRASAKRRREDPGWSPVVGEGACPYCGATFPPRLAPTCGKPACQAAFARRGFYAFKRRVRWPLPLAWLAPKIGRCEDDPLLPKLALALALKGKLVVYVRADGTVGEVGRPK